MKIYGVFLNNLVVFIFFLSPERKPKQKKECENVLSSEAGTQILQITQGTRSAQTAFRISLLRLRTAIRDSMLIQRICIPLKSSSCGMFLSVFFTRQILHSRAVALIKTFRTRRSLEAVLFSESSSILVSRSETSKST